MRIVSKHANFVTKVYGIFGIINKKILNGAVLAYPTTEKASGLGKLFGNSTLGSMVLFDNTSLTI